MDWVSVVIVLFALGACGAGIGLLLLGVAALRTGVDDDVWTKAPSAPPLPAPHEVYGVSCCNPNVTGCEHFQHGGESTCCCQMRPHMPKIGKRGAL